MTDKLTYTVETLRDAGLEARWSHTSAGRPALFARDPNRKADREDTWWMVDRQMWVAMEDHGIRIGFDEATALGDFFSVPA